MLSKEDYKNYLEQIIRLEGRMAAIYKECTDGVEEDSVKKVCSGLSDAERQHVLIIKELVGLFNV